MFGRLLTYALVCLRRFKSTTRHHKRLTDILQIQGEGLTTGLELGKPQPRRTWCFERMLTATVADCRGAPAAELQCRPFGHVNIVRSHCKHWIQGSWDLPGSPSHAVPLRRFSKPAVLQGTQTLCRTMCSEAIDGRGMHVMHEWKFPSAQPIPDIALKKNHTIVQTEEETPKALRRDPSATWLGLRRGFQVP